MKTVLEEKPLEGQLVWVWLAEEWRIATFEVKHDGKLEWMLLHAEIMTAKPEHVWTPAYPPAIFPKY